MDDRDNCTRLSRVDVFVSMPGPSNRPSSIRASKSERGHSRCSWASLGFTVADNTNDDKIGLVHDSTEGNAESVTKFATFVYGTWGLCIDMTREYVRTSITRAEVV